MDALDEQTSSFLGGWFARCAIARSPVSKENERGEGSIVAASVHTVRYGADPAFELEARVKGVDGDSFAAIRRRLESNKVRRVAMSGTRVRPQTRALVSRRSGDGHDGGPRAPEQSAIAADAVLRLRLDAPVAQPTEQRLAIQGSRRQSCSVAPLSHAARAGNLSTSGLGINFD